MYQVATGMLGEIGGLNNGVGYTLPFECSAAPWLDGQKLSDVLNSRRLPGLKFLPITYTPYYGAYKGQVVCGVRLFFTDASAAPLTAVNFHILEAVKKVSKRDLAAEAAKASKNFEMFDRVNGTDATRKALQSGVSASAIVASWKKEEEAFRQLRQQYLLYP
jgi:uncharacterized protein YbbC (DUF1343 family)